MTQDWVTVADADAYFAERLGASEHWTSGADKEAALQTAYNDLIACGEFDFALASGESFDSGESALDEWKVALYEQALFLLADPDIDARISLQAQGVATAGIVKESYRASAAGAVVIAPRARAVASAYALNVMTGSFPIER